MKVLQFVGVALLGVLPQIANAWDPVGHMLVGQIAWSQLTPAVRTQVASLVEPLDAEFNAGQKYNFVTAGCWMDDMRSKRGYAWSKWHYVNIPFTPSGIEFELPAPPHVVWAIGENVKTLRNAEATPAQRTEALVMLMHFVGDVHQPMHATERGDRGGNGVLIHGVPFSDLWPGTVANLHAFWDKAFRFAPKEGKIIETMPPPALEARPTGPDEGVIAEEAAKIMTEFPPTALREVKAASDEVEWARESHKLGCLSGYPPDALVSDHQVVEIPPDFAQRAREVARRRVALAGYRLGALLNELLTPR